MTQANPPAEIRSIRIGNSQGLGSIAGCFLISAVMVGGFYFIATAGSSKGVSTLEKVVFCSIFFGVTTIPLSCALFGVWQRLKFGCVTLILDGPVLNGGVLAGKIKVSKHLILNRAEYISLELKCVQMVSAGGKNTSIKTATLKKTESKVTRGKITLLSDGTTEIPFQIEFPSVPLPAGWQKFMHPVWWEMEAEAMPNNKGSHFCASFKLG